jgi:hypothetical protein
MQHDCESNDWKADPQWRCEKTDTPEHGLCVHTHEVPKLYWQK